MSTNQPRKPAGIPSGGQWAPAQHAEIEDIDVSPPAATAACRRANWEKLDSEHYYTDQLDDARCHEIGPDGKPDERSSGHSLVIPPCRDSWGPGTVTSVRRGCRKPRPIVGYAGASTCNPSDSAACFSRES